MRKRLLAIPFALLLSGCYSHDDVSQVYAEHDRQCRQAGGPNSADYLNCREHLRRQAAFDWEMRRQATAQRLQHIGTVLQSAPTGPPQNNITCTTTPMAGMSQTNCTRW
jgi:hypothetical protein